MLKEKNINSIASISLNNNQFIQVLTNIINSILTSQKSLNIFILYIFSLLNIATYSSDASEKNDYFITGRLLDYENKQPILSAKIALYEFDSTSNEINLIKGTLSQKDGIFNIEFDIKDLNKKNRKIKNLNQVLNFQFLILKITSINYQDTIFDNQNYNFIFNNNAIDFKDILLPTKSILTDEALVTAEKPLIEITPEGKLFNVEDNALVVGGSLLDVLQVTPSVAVDFDGNVSMRGSDNLIILIDGQNVPSSSDVRLSLLESIPASTVESIEIINSPNAKYNPKGVGGVINIKLKKKRNLGFNGTISSNVGTRDKYNTSLNFNYGFNGLNFFFSNDTRIDTRVKNSELDFNSLLPTNTINNTLISGGFRRYLNNNTRLGFDVFDDNKTINFFINYNTRESKSPENINDIEKLITTNNTRILSEQNTNIGNKSNENNLLISSAYTYKFDRPKEKLKIDINYSEKSSLDFLSRLTASNNITNFQFQSNLDDMVRNLNFEMSYTLPLSYNNLSEENLNLNSNLNSKNINATKILTKVDVKSKIEFGVFANVRRADNSYIPEIFDFRQNNWQIYDSLNNRYNLRRQIYSAFINYDIKFDDFFFEAGLRAETANINLTQLQNNQTNIIDYKSLFPNLGLKYNFNQSNIFNFNFSRRIDRPSINNLNPFIEIDNPLLIKYGNPALQPEFINSFDLGYTLIKNKRTIFSSLYYRNIENAIRRYNFLDSNTNVINSTYSNFSGVNFVGMEFIYEEQLAKWFKITSTLNIFYNSIKGNEQLNIQDNDRLTWNYKLNSNVKFFWDIDLQGFISYEAPQITPQGTISSFVNLNFAFKKEITENLTLALRVTDLLNTYEYHLNNSATNFDNYTYRKKETQVVFLNLTYKFNQNELGKKSKENKENKEFEENYENELDNKND